jgi:molecular chaperone DnaK (HSP70)
VGIDLGTTFTAAAVGDATGTRMVALSPEIVVPSLAYHAPDGTLLTGIAARAAAEDPSRLGRGFKRRLGDPTPLMLGGAAYSPAALMAAQLRAVLDAVTHAMGGPPASVVLTCPAIWGPYRREQFAEVSRLADRDQYLGDHQLITEPEAAATHYSRERTLGEGEVVAVYDLGGGTLDTTVLRMGPDGMEILGTPEGIEHLGGMDFDDALLAHVDERLGGAIGRLDPTDPAASAALAEIRRLCVRTKIDLSTEPDVTLTLPLPSGRQELTITRLEFNAVIRPSVELTVGALRRTVASAGLTDDDLSAVLLAGGSSRIPLVTQLVFEEFDRPVRVTQHPKFTVALGAATIAAHATEVTPPPVAPPDEPAPRPPKKRWLVPTTAAVLTVAAALVITLVTYNANSGHAVDTAANTKDTTSTTTTTAVAAEAPSSVDTAAVPEPLVLFNDKLVKPYRAFIASPEKWDGTELVGKAASHSAISASMADGLRVTWHGGTPAQVYLQTVNSTRDLAAYADNKGALVFDVLVHSPAQGTTSIATHCQYPCGAELDATTLFQKLPVGTKTTVTIPLSCFTAMGLNKSLVNTPFLVYSQGPFDVTFRNVEWVPGAADHPDATPCAALS